MHSSRPGQCSFFDTISSDLEFLDSQGVARPAMGPNKRAELIESLVDAKFPEVRVSRKVLSCFNTGNLVCTVNQDNIVGV